MSVVKIGRERRSMRVDATHVYPLLATVAAATTACADLHSGPQCSDPVATGDYTVAIRPILDSHVYGWRFELSGDGTFAGHLGPGWPGAPARCDGSLTPEEAARLTDAINAGAFFCRGNTFYDTVYDVPYVDVEVRTLDGSRNNRFCVHAFSGYDPAYGELSSASGFPLLRVHDAGGCTGLPYEVPVSTDHCSLWPRPPPTPPP